MTIESRKSKVGIGAILIAIAALSAWSVFGAATIPTNEGRASNLVQTCSPLDASWWEGQALTAATSSPYQPGSISSSLRLPMGGFSGLVVRARYPRAQTISTAPVVLLWGYKGGDWCNLADVNAALTVTLDDAATDADDGATYKWTAPSAKLDALGSTHIVATCSTAGVASGAGAITLEITRF